ncbi:Hypothetical predicted protein [Octopus vulgaris]|uniref:Uncharacterized protein n=1 Tax=Octopus vulgaris TaxID=6645 RepID=A0AA36EVW0_OCTVU|nr:Hypothetical predicted protein [Octopus vulgaris]
MFTVWLLTFKYPHFGSFRDGRVPQALLGLCTISRDKPAKRATASYTGGVFPLFSSMSAVIRITSALHYNTIGLFELTTTDLLPYLLESSLGKLPFRSDNYKADANFNVGTNAALTFT